MKSHLWLGMLAFIVQLGLPQVSLAAANAPVVPVIVSPVDFLASDFIDKEEKFFQAWMENQEQYLPLENQTPRVLAERWVTTTAYSSEPRQTDSTPFTTAWQTPVRAGVVALNFLPLGSLVRFPDVYGDKIFVVEDRMNARYTYRADIWMLETADAKRFGLQYLRLEILGARYPRDYVLATFAPAFPGRK